MSTESQQAKQSLSGRIAVVTGGCGGIGTAVCARLAREGAQVYAADLRGGDTIKADEVIFHEHDVSSEESALEQARRYSAQLETTFLEPVFTEEFEKRGFSSRGSL